MKRVLVIQLFFIFVIYIPFSVLAREYIADDELTEDYLAEDYLTEADIKYNIGGMENYKDSLNICLKGLAIDPNNYELLWRSARAYRYYGLAIKKRNLAGWKKMCIKYGQEGMQQSLKATALEPKKLQGYYYFGYNVALYADGVDISDLTLSLKNQTQDSLEYAYKLNKLFDDAGPMVLLGRYWARVPWPFRDQKKALKYYREYLASTNYIVDKPERTLVIAELLVELKGKENIKEAKHLLNDVMKSNDTYFKAKAKALLEKINHLS